MSEFLLKEKNVKPEVCLKLLTLALNIPFQKNDNQMARILYLLGYIFGLKNKNLESSSFFEKAKMILNQLHCYESVECMFLEGLIEKNVKNNQKEGTEMILKSKEDSQFYPVWHSKMIYTIVPEMEFEELM